MDDPVQIGVIGCGAGARNLHLPAETHVPEIRVCCLVDTNRERAEELADEFNVSATATDHHELVENHTVDAVLIATPPATHADISEYFLKKSIPVLCEKPIATDVEAVERLLQIARQNGVSLIPGRNRRYNHRIQLGRTLLQRNITGPIHQIKVVEGKELDWPLKTLSFFRRDEAGGGILMDAGPHLLDLIGWMTEGTLSLKEYRDDARGGVEANAELSFSVSQDQFDIPANLTLSTTRNLGKSMRFVGESGVLKIPTMGEQPLEFTPDKNEDAEYESISGLMDVNDNRSGGGEFARQLRDFAKAVRSGRQYTKKAKEALRHQKFIQECYDRRTALDHPWESPEPETRPAVQISSHERVCVLGASGFVGNRFIERLYREHPTAQVTATAHRSSSPGLARLARYPVDLHRLDLLNIKKVQKSIENSQIVIHLAYGNHEEILPGTKNVVKACRGEDVEQLIYFSSAVVHGRTREGTVTESDPLVSGGSGYAGGKADSERFIRKELNDDETSFTIFRPTCIWGPGGSRWTAQLAQKLKQGPVLLKNGEEVPAQVVYVDNVVDAVISAMGNADAYGEAFLLDDDEDLSWNDYHRAYLEMMDNPPSEKLLSLKNLKKTRYKYCWNEFKKHVAFPWRLVKAMAASEHVRAEVRNVWLLRWLLSFFSAEDKHRWKQTARKQTGPETTSNHSPDTPEMILDQAPWKDLQEMITSGVNYKPNKARKILDWSSLTPIDKGFQTTETWLKSSSKI